MSSKLDALRFSQLGQFRIGIFFSFANSFVWMIALGTPMVLLCEYLGANASQVGLLYAAVFLMLPVQLASTALLPILGFRRQILYAWGTRTAFLLVPLVIVFWAPLEPAEWVLSCFVGSIFAFCFFRSIGASALLPWLFSILPDSIRGRYFASDSLMVGVGGVIALLLSSGLFYILSAYNAFRILFTLSFIAAVISLILMSRLPEGSRPVVIPLRRLFRRAPELCFRPSHFRRFLRLQVVYAIAGYAFIPFSIFYLKTELNCSQSYILALTALQFVGIVFAAMIIKEWIDRLGTKPFFMLSNLCTIAFQLYWLLLIIFPGTMQVLLPAVYVLVGVAMASFQIATNKYLPQVCHARERALSVSLFGAAVGFIGGITSTGWGYLLKDSVTGLINTKAFLVYFISALALQFLLLKGYMKIKDVPNTAEALPTRGMMVRPFRYLVSFINMVEPPVKKRPLRKPKF